MVLRGIQLGFQLHCYLQPTFKINFTKRSDGAYAFEIVSTYNYRVRLLTVSIAIRPGL